MKTARLTYPHSLRPPPLTALSAALLATGWAHATPIAVPNHSFEADENVEATGAFADGSRADFGGELTGWIAQSGTASQVAVGWKDITVTELHPDPPVGSQESQALSLQSGASVLNYASTAWSSLTAGEELTLTISLGMRNVGALNWNEGTFFGLTDSDADLTTIEPADTVANSGIIANNPATGTQLGDGTFTDSFFSYTVQAADLARPGNIGILIYSEGTGASGAANQSFFDNVRLERTGFPGLGLISHYKFDTDNGGSTPDVFGGNSAALGSRVQINTVVSGAIGTGALGMLGGGATAGPSDGAVTSNTFSWGNGARTLTFWWRQSGADTAAGAFISMGNGDGSTDGERFEVKEKGSATDLRVEVQGTGQDSNPTDFDDGNWHFVAVTVPDNATFADVAWYTDGDRNDLNTSTNTLALATTSSAMAFGDSVLNVDPNGRVPNGFLDEVQVYNRVLTEDEILSLFTTPGSVIDDGTPPAVVALSPADDATSVDSDAMLEVFFDEPIAAVSGDITIKNLTDSTQSTIAVTDGSQVSISGNVLTINPAFVLSAGKDYAVQIAAGAVQDFASTPNSFAGITDDETWSFTVGSRLIQPIEFYQDDQAGFDLWPGAISGKTTTANFTTDPVATSGTTTVTITANESTETLGIVANRGSVDGTPPGYSYQHLYEDLLIATTPTGFLTIDVSGLNAGQAYRFTLYSWDPGSTNTDDKVWTVTGGTGVPASDSVNYSDPLVDNQTFAMVFDITTDGSGAFQLTNTAGLEQSGINGFILEIPESPGNTYPNWAAANAGGQGPELDFNKNGVPNGVEFFMGGTLASPATIPLPVNTGGTWTFTIPYDPTATVSSWKFQVSEDLVNWDDFDDGDTEVQVLTGPDEIKLTLPASATGRKFVRLVVVVG